MKQTALTYVCAALLWAGLAGSPAAQNNYLLGSQDVVNITVFGEPDLSRKYTIEQDGTFTFPYIGRVKAKGLTLRELEQELRKRLMPDYLRDPQISVAVENYQSQRITVMGQVNQPGEYQLTGEMTLLSALARAGSVTATAGSEVIIARTPRPSGNGSAANEPEVIRVDLPALMAGDMSLNVRLMDGDQINVPKAQSAFVSGHVRTPGAYPVERGMTVLQVLTLAGGVSDRGSDKRISIERVVNGKRTVKKSVKLTDIVEPGDTIVVGPRFF